MQHRKSLMLGFFQQLTTPIQKASGLIVDMEKFQKQLDEVKMQSAMEEIRPEPPQTGVETSDFPTDIIDEDEDESENEYKRFKPSIMLLVTQLERVYTQR